MMCSKKYGTGNELFKIPCAKKGSGESQKSSGKKSRQGAKV
jgi:hypothetical protein